jgi:arsenite methyltransferase
MTELADFELRDGIYVHPEDGSESSYRRVWEQEARHDHVVSAIARPAPDDSLQQLTAKVTPIWDRLPAGSRFDTILDVGCGYGRLALALSSRRGVRCERYIGLDISEAMLRHLARYWRRFDPFPGAEPVLVRASADRLPLEDRSVDLVVSSAVFLHMGRAYVREALAEIARVLLPGGRFVFESSFPNRFCPANAPSVLRGLLGERRPNQLKYYSRGEVERLVRGSGLPARVPGYEIVPNERAVLPKSVGRRAVPHARRLNAIVNRRVSRGDRVFAASFTVASTNLDA